MNRNSARVLLNKLREHLYEEFPEDKMTKEEAALFDEIDAAIMDFEDRFKI